MKKYLVVWVVASIVVGFEYYALNFSPQMSLLLKAQSRGLIDQTLNISSTPGRMVSLWLGWVGLSLMISMNVYSMRKRLAFMQNWGKLSAWLNFHVFCGLLGPTFILFHCNFKVRGLVSISFWSMVVSFASGIIGRYFYVQMLREKSQFESEADRMEEKIEKMLKKSLIETSSEETNKYKELALRHAGLLPGDFDSLNPFQILLHAFAGDIRLSLGPPIVPAGWPSGSRYLLAGFAINKRRATLLAPFQKLMGYWHAFHFPFAIFMYIVAVIHVMAAMILGV